DREPVLESLRRGDRDAFEDLVKRNAGHLLAVARRMLGNEADACDVVQDAMLSAFRAVGRFDGLSKLSTWLHRIVVNAALMKLRPRRRKPGQSSDELLPSFDASGSWRGEPACSVTAGEALLETREERALVRRSIDRLPDTYRLVLLLRDIEELDTEETA